MPNKKSGTIDYLTVAGEAGSETYQCPNTAAYIAADTDYIWFGMDSSLSTATTANLVAYDFTRTIIKYSNSVPYAIEAILILSSDIAAGKVNQLHKDFALSVYWSGVWNDYGQIKDNRASARSLIYDTDALAFMLRQKTAGDGADGARMSIINTAYTLAKTKAFWAKMDAIWTMAAHGDVSARLNWIADTFPLIDGVAPNFTIDQGFAGTGTQYLRTGIVPSAGSLHFTKDACSFGVYCRTNQNAATAAIGTRNNSDGFAAIYLRSTDVYYGYANDGEIHAANTDSRGLFSVSRTSDTVFSIYKNTTKTVGAGYPTDVLSGVEFYILCYNKNGVATNKMTGQLALAYVGGALTDQDIADIKTVFVDGYLTSIGAAV